MNDATATPPEKASGAKQFLIIFFAVLLAIVVAAIAIRVWIFPPQFKPVTLRPAEQATLNHKLRRLGYQQEVFATDRPQSGGALEPQPYSEAGANREVRLSERELNALLARNTELAQKLAIDLSDELASARLVLPLPPDFPFLGGQTLRMSAGIEASFADGRPLLRLRGVSLWGVPLPNAWLGNLKNVDLVAQFGEQPGFWKSFADGIDQLQVRDGELYVRLRE